MRRSVLRSKACEFGAVQDLGSAPDVRDFPPKILKQSHFSPTFFQLRILLRSCCRSNMSTAGLLRLGTSGYGTYVGNGDDEQPTTTAGDAGVNRKGSAVHRGSFYGRLGTKTAEAESEASISKSDTGKVPEAMKQMRVQLFYDEDAYPAGVELDLFALLYDKECKYLDCVFYRNTEGANGAFSLNVSTNSLAMDLTRVPEECSIIVLAAAVYTLGLSILELEGGRIQISGGFVGPTVKDIVLAGLRPPPGAPSTSGLVYFAIGEANGKWYYKDALMFTNPSLDAIMRPAKELATDLHLEMEQPKRYGLQKLDSLLQAANALDRTFSLASDSTDVLRADNHPRLFGDPIAQSLTRANTVRRRIAALKQSISSQDSLLESPKSGMDEVFRRRLNGRLSDIEERQNILEETLSKVITRLDYLYAFLEVDEDQ
ncbi:hypothetical protein TGDOM2_254870 [Toxoplasma gondii GAB2-2007-GAL-DOM2]|uniref:Uncharacterized protein n=3 Tax=Toxoplasma gondii TaxID=5811 RepID=B9QIJ2_TOXGV|nr:hypothetical protein TGVEG_254870 [Toxoplasma gondii VEG]KFG35353.1 hypothetical protein TGDOM2_254870 [Toxoplasma gondii GAB2-2007-GAL-DOM2]RQX68489.1 hypothetical protein TGCAST_254870 [Toxoplasma gondii CAST]CEL72346.1 TPA: hypothetical protein BN1205_058210 [Toxoplasma gondii VEG]